jgi:prepilin-type processing-associated H-X9-DG protein
MKLISRLFRTSPLPPHTAAVELAPRPPEPAPPVIDPEEQQELLRAIESGSLESAELVRLAVEGQTTRLRQAAASRIQDPASWQTLLPRLRGRDKAAYKLIKERHDALLTAQRNEAQARRDAEAVCADLEKLAVKAYDVLFASTLSEYAARWQALAAVTDATIRERGQRALERSQEVVTAHEQELARVAAERAAEQARASALEAQRLSLQQAADEQAAIDAREQAAAEEAGGNVLFLDGHVAFIAQGTYPITDAVAEATR